MAGNLSAIFSLVLIMCVGWFMGYKKWVGEDGANAFVKILGAIALPAVTGYQGLNMDTSSFFSDAPIAILTAFLSIIVTMLISVVVIRIIKVPEGRRGLFTVLFATCNTILVGVPVIESFYSQDVIVYVVYYFVANTTITWSIGVYLIKRDAAILRGENTSFTFRDLKKAISLPLITFIIGLCVNISGVHIPGLFTTTVSYLSRMATPLGLMYAGLLIYLGGKKSLNLKKGHIGVFAGRFIICPLVIMALSTIFSLPIDMRNVFVLEAAMPTAVQSVVISGLYGADDAFASTALSWTLALLIIAAPSWVFITSMI